MTDDAGGIVILGAGYGGLAAFRRFRALGVTRRMPVTIISRDTHFVVMPLLHEVATGGLPASNAAVSVREIIGPDPTAFLHAEISGIDAERSVVHTSAGDVPYRHLVIATGSTNRCTVPGSREHALPLKNLADARRIRLALVHAMERAAAVRGTHRRPLEIIVVGGGPTGIELAGEIADLCRHTLGRHFARRERWHYRVSVLHAGTEVLPQFHRKLRAWARRTLHERGVEVRLGCTVTGVSPGRVLLEDGRELTGDIVIWAAGIEPCVPGSLPGMPRQASGRLLVDEHLHVSGAPGVWSVGDAAGAMQPGGIPVPARAQAAVQQGRTVAENITALLAGRPLQPFRYRQKGELVPLGRYRAVADVAGIQWAGRSAWWLNRLVYLVNVPCWGDRVRIAIDWIVNIFHPRDIGAW